MVDIHEAPDIKLEEYLNRWLDAMMEVYGDILQEWSNLQTISQIFLGISIFITLVGIVILSIKHAQKLQDNSL